MSELYLHDIARYNDRIMLLTFVIVSERIDFFAKIDKRVKIH